MSKLREPVATADLDELIEEIIVDAYGDDEQLWAFRQAFEDAIRWPADGFVVGAPVAVLKIDYDGSSRRGLTAQCRRSDGSKHVVSAADVVFPAESRGARYVAAYRKWLGLKPDLEASADSHRRRQHKATADNLDLRGPVELVVLSVKERAARCRVLHSDRIITLRSSSLWELVPGEITKVKPSKLWRYGRHPYLSGEVESKRLDAAALGLVPLRLEEQGMWDPQEEYWGEEGEPIAEWAKTIIDHGPRPQYQMEQVLPGFDPDDPFSDPITESNDCKDSGDFVRARQILMQLCDSDLRCLDAHAHLGNFVFDRRPKDALRHYEAGLRIGELSLGADFDGVLSWGFVDNRPFLRCMQGYGLCLWRMERFDEALRVFERLLWLNPSDNQGVRFLLNDIRAKRPWEAHEH